MKNQIVLASESPRRRDLLTQAGIPFRTVSANADEIKEGEPVDVVTSNAVKKAEAGQKLCPDQCVLGADTIVCLEGRIFGKPGNAEEAFEMLRALSGRWHQVYTGVALSDGDGRMLIEYDVTNVHFTNMSDEEITSYISTGEPFGKAGAYAIQGQAGYYIDRIEGSYSNVIGLPLTTVRKLLKETGFIR